jgi:hypothetical protein
MDVPSLVAIVTGSSFDPVGKGESNFSSIDDIGAVLIAGESIVLHIVSGGLVFYLDANFSPFLGSKKF